MVDNGSGAEVVEYLRTCEAREPRLKVIFNGENLGFARANNIGIRAAGECEYVVLLNNDTVVTRGWLCGLVRHLQSPGVGLVGPVTNAIGNEAKIEVGYKGLEGMDQFAERYTRAHAGGWFEIPVLAMYCLAMRRSLLDQVGLLDERYGVGMFEDDDFALTVRQAGKQLVCAEDVFVHHWGQASFGKLPPGRYDQLFEDNRRKFEQKWGRKWEPHRYRK